MISGSVGDQLGGRTFHNFLSVLCNCKDINHQRQGNAVWRRAQQRSSFISDGAPSNTASPWIQLFAGTAPETRQPPKIGRLRREEAKHPGNGRLLSSGFRPGHPGQLPAAQLEDFPPQRAGQLHHGLQDQRGGGRHGPPLPFLTLPGKASPAAGFEKRAGRRSGPPRVGRGHPPLLSSDAVEVTDSRRRSALGRKNFAPKSAKKAIQGTFWANVLQKKAQTFWRKPFWGGPGTPPPGVGLDPLGEG